MSCDCLPSRAAGPAAGSAVPFPSRILPAYTPTRCAVRPRPDPPAALGRVPDVYREPLVLQVLFGYSTEEIAKHLDISVPAVLTRLFRARQVLRQQLVGVKEDSRP